MAIIPFLGEIKFLFDNNMLDLLNFFKLNNYIAKLFFMASCSYYIYTIDICLQLQAFVNYYYIPNLMLPLLLFESDKLKKSAASSARLSVMKAVKDFPSVNVQLFSSLKKEGVPELCMYLDEVFEMNNES